MPKMKFKSRHYTFRPTAISEQLRALGVTDNVHMIREERCFGLLRDKNDTFNSRPSRPVHLHTDTRATA